jgi:uncharacterized membrane protein
MVSVNLGTAKPKIIIFFSLILASAASLAMLLARFVYSGVLSYAFLVWNLFLAWVPLIFSLLADVCFEKRTGNGVLAILCGIVWLVFFPNAPYIVTDFLHLGATGQVPQWFDLILILSFALTGLFLGFTSLYVMQNLVTKVFGKRVGWVFVVFVLGLCGFGIYLGRFLGWNSWDVLVDPKTLAGDVVDRLAHPFLHRRTFAVSSLLAVVFISMYLTLFSLTRLPRESYGGS